MDSASDEKGRPKLNTAAATYCLHASYVTPLLYQTWLADIQYSATFTSKVTVWSVSTIHRWPLCAHHPLRSICLYISISGVKVVEEGENRAKLRMLYQVLNVTRGRFFFVQSFFNKC